MKNDRLLTAQTIMKSFTMLPTIPAAAIKAVRLLNEDVVDLEAVADIVLSDQVLAARVIRIINSPLYKMVEEVKSVRKALIYLGAQRIFEIIITSCFLEATDVNERSPLKIRHFWGHAFGVALVARRLAESISYPQPENAYMAGVLHDIGKVILSQNRRQEYTRAIVLAQSEHSDIYHAEMEVFGTSHADIGYLLGKEWNFPADFLEAVYTHHNDLKDMNKLTLLVALANCFCNSVGINCLGNCYKDQDDETKAVRLIQEYLPSLDTSDFEGFMISMENLSFEVRCAVEVIYP